MTWLQFTIYALAVYRLARMITKEAGPFWMFRRLRGKVKQKAPESTHMDEGIECPFCMSMQCALLLVVLGFFFAGTLVFDGAMLALALSGAAVLLKTVGG